MAATLQEILLAPETQPKVIDDCLALIDQEVSEKSGVSGTAIKVAYKTASAFASGYLRNTVESLLPDIVDALAPFWDDFTASGGSDFSTSGGSEFGDYLAKRGEEVSQALLAVSDARAAISQRPVIIKAYQAVRTSAGRHIEAALPQVGKLVLKYAS
jgi:hypothetical protein